MSTRLRRAAPDASASHPAVRAAAVEALGSGWRDSSLSQVIGHGTKRSVARARAAVASLVGAMPDEVVFTQGATEANAIALASAMRRPGVVPRIVVCALGQPGLLATAEHLAAEGIRVDRIAVDRHGRIDEGALQAALAEPAALISVPAANSETGVLQPIARIALLARASRVPMHVDASHTAGRVWFSFSTLNIDLLTLSARELGGPHGVGALVMRHASAACASAASGHERLQAEAENVVGIVGFGAAAAIAKIRLAADAEHLSRLRNALESGLRARCPALKVFGDRVPRLPNTSCVRFGDLGADAVLARLEHAGVLGATGLVRAFPGSATACPAQLQAMGVAPAEAHCAVRFLLARDHALTDVDALVACAGDRVSPLLAVA